MCQNTSRIQRNITIGIRETRDIHDPIRYIMSQQQNNAAANNVSTTINAPL